MQLLSLMVGMLVLSAALFVAVAEPDPGNTMSFAVMRNDERIGTNTIRLDRDGTGTTVQIVTHVQVKIAFVTMYRFDQTETERWVDGHLLAMSSVTDDNGTVHRVKATSGNNKITVDADGKTTEVAGSTIPASLWNPMLLDRTTALNPQDGSMMPIAVVYRGEEHLVLQGGERRAQHYLIRSTFPQDVWYDDQRQLVKVELTGPDGSTIRYSRDNAHR
jgi:hypothetical protein